MNVNISDLIERYPDDIKAHAKRVAYYARKYGTRYELVGLLHDIIEDTCTTLEELPVDVRDDVAILTRNPNDTYFDYIRNIKKYGSHRAFMVKLFDIYDHLNQKETLTKSLEKRYLKALEILKG